MVTDLKMMWLITAILVAMPSLTLGSGTNVTLTESNPSHAFQTPKILGRHKAKEDIWWKVSAPGNAAKLNLTCDVNIYKSLNCLKASFMFYNYDRKIILCKTIKFSKTLKGSTSIFKFKSSMLLNTGYKGVFCTVSYNPDDILTSTTPVNPSCRCGEKKWKRIIGGKETSSHAYPWQALLKSLPSMYQFCGGSVIATQWVLTATHCVIKKSACFVLVVLGEHNYENSDSFSQDFRVKKIIMHENCTKEYNVIKNDIALLNLVSPVAFTHAISPICLPFNYKYYDFTDNTGIATGWGATILGDKENESKFLKEIEQKIIMPFKCTWFDNHFYSPIQITKNTICAVAQNGGTYSGDSGGPIVWKSDSSNLYFQLGVLSTGPMENDWGNPDLYARVSQFVDWIEKKTGVGKELCVKI